MRFNLQKQIKINYNTQTEFAKVTGISRQRINHIVNGDRPYATELETIREYLGESKTLFYNKEI